MNCTCTKQPSLTTLSTVGSIKLPFQITLYFSITRCTREVNLVASSHICYLFLGYLECTPFMRAGTFSGSLCLFVVLSVVKLRPQLMLGKHATSELHPLLCFYFITITPAPGMDLT
jgi:hypothetical protein